MNDEARMTNVEAGARGCNRQAAKDAKAKTEFKRKDAKIAKELRMEN